MHPTHRVSGRAWTAALLALLLCAAVLAAPATASDHKTFTAAIAPQAVGAGQHTTFTATITNTAPQHQLGSVNITLPNAFTGVDAVTLGGAGSGAVTGNTIELRNLALQPGDAVSVTFDGTSPCDAAAYEFAFQGKQANNFRGPPGNDFTLSGDAANRTVSVTGECGGRLAFVTQPAHTQLGDVITGAIGAPSATGVQVAVVNDDDEVVPADVEITVALGSDPSGGAATLSGSLTRSTGATGIATFDDLKIDTLGAGYTLAASSPGFATALSQSFGIWEDIAVCTAGASCTTSVTRQRQFRVEVTGTGQAGSAMLLSVLGEEINCAENWDGPGDYPFNHAPATSLYEPVGTFSGSTIVTLRIDKSVVREVPNNGAAFYQICFLGEKPFEDRDGQTASANPDHDGMFGPALLADCGQAGPAAAPCVISRTKTQGGDMVLEFAIPSEDPAFR
jgi:hypothetical protein